MEKEKMLDNTEDNLVSSYFDWSDTCKKILCYRSDAYFSSVDPEIHIHVTDM